MQTDFQPVYIQPTELGYFGLPSTCMNLVLAASSAIDVWCQKADQSGYGSLVYSTYTERVVLKANSNPNVFRLTWRPLVGVSPTDIAALAASGTEANYTGSGAWLSSQGFDNGALASTYPRLNSTTGELCAILAISGRYSRTRNDDPFGGLMPYLNPMNVSQLFGGPPVWFALDPTQCEYDPRKGEVWAPPGIYWTRFSEVEVTYTSGFDPRHMPRNIKQACANIVKNMLTKPIPGVTSMNFSDAAMSMAFSPTYIDTFTQGLLIPYKTVVYG